MENKIVIVFHTDHLLFRWLLTYFEVYTMTEIVEILPNDVIDI